MENANTLSASDKKRMTSITRRLYVHTFGMKIRLYIAEDLLLAIIMFFGWIFYTETLLAGNFVLSRSREIFTTEGIFSTLVYRVSDGTGELFTVNAFAPFVFMITVLGSLLFIQLVFKIGIGSIFEHAKIRKILSPINEMALKADELNRMTSFADIDMYVELEHAIDRIKPDEEKTISFGDSSLAGIEAAINNLLIRMRETYEQQSRFVNDASHELRTPIAVIKGYSDMLKRWGSSDPQVLNEGIEAISHEIEHMNILVEQLLFLARGDSGRTTLKLENISLNDMVNEIYEESFMIDEDHPYRFKAPEEKITAEADPALLKQAVRILIDNAAKYTNKGDEIKLGIGKTEEGFPYIQVQDTGIGMAEADVEHMFERFYRSDEARNYKGTGLGLSIAKWIVDRHRGHFEILSRTELGTRIRIVLEKPGAPLQSE